MARSGVKSQQDKRRTLNVKDQHGRPWTVVIEKETGDPCGVIIARFEAPWYPDQKYLRLDGNRLRVNYRAMARDNAEARTLYERALRDAARKLPGVDWRAAAANPPQELLDIVGPPPLDRRVIQFAHRGSKWLLGLSDTKPSWAEEMPLFAVVEDTEAISLREAMEADASDFGLEDDDDFDDDLDDVDGEGIRPEKLHVTARDKRNGADRGTRERRHARMGRKNRGATRRERTTVSRGAQTAEQQPPAGAERAPATAGPQRLAPISGSAAPAGAGADSTSTPGGE